jgi:hypothetical protein
MIELTGELRSVDSFPPLSLFHFSCAHLVRLASSVLVCLSPCPLLVGDGRPLLSRATTLPSLPAGLYRSSTGSNIRCTWLTSLRGAQWCSPRGPETSFKFNHKGTIVISQSEQLLVISRLSVSVLIGVAHLARSSVATAAAHRQAAATVAR